MPTHVVVDGSNIATEGGSTPSLKQLDEAVQAFMAEHPSDRLTVVVDASFGHRIDPSERAAYEEAIEANELITPPAGTTGRGDAFILEIADRAGATVLSNDSFQEFHGEHTWLFDDGRLIGGKPVPDVGWVFLPRTPVRGPTSRRATRDAGRAARTADSRGAPAEEAEKATKSGSSSGRSRGRGGRGRGRGRSSGDATPVEGSDAADTDAPKAARGTTSKSASPRPTKAEPLNDALPFIEFVGAHPVGSTVTGEVERFTSHGAHVLVSGVRCYVDLAGLGDPAPTRARDVLDKDAEQDFLIVAVDTPRRGIDLALPGSIAAKEAGIEAPAPGGRSRRKKAAAPAAEKAPAKKASGRKKKAAAPAEKAAKAPAKKTGGRGSKKAPAEKAPAKKASKRAPKKSADARKRGAASAPLPPEPGDMSYGTIAQPAPKKKGLLGRLTGRG
jgi:hypothetical protein